MFYVSVWCNALTKIKRQADYTNKLLMSIKTTHNFGARKGEMAASTHHKLRFLTNAFFMFPYDAMHWLITTLSPSMRIQFYRTTKIKNTYVYKFVFYVYKLHELFKWKTHLYVINISTIGKERTRWLEQQIGRRNTNTNLTQV